MKDIKNIIGFILALSGIIIAKFSILFLFFAIMKLEYKYNGYLIGFILLISGITSFIIGWELSKKL
jgi:hypothetical protein